MEKRAKTQAIHTRDKPTLEEEIRKRREQYLVKRAEAIMERPSKSPPPE
jgi:hypothetical protein